MSYLTSFIKVSVSAVIVLASVKGMSVLLRKAERDTERKLYLKSAAVVLGIIALIFTYIMATGVPHH